QLERAAEVIGTKTRRRGDPRSRPHAIPGLDRRSLDRAQNLIIEGPAGVPKYYKGAQKGLRQIHGTQVCVIGYFAKIVSARLKALSIACSGVIPLFMTSSMAMLKTCSALTSAIAGLNAS